MLRALRQQVQGHLAGVKTARKPALRRTDDPDALLMCDLPRIAEKENMAVFIRAMEADGWRVREIPGWLLLDHDVPVPQAERVDDAPGESGCCAWLLQKHPGDAPAQGHIRALVKAAEQGSDKVERLCRQWHGEFAACLREHKPLPGGVLPYLQAAMKEEAR